MYWYLILGLMGLFSYNFPKTSLWMGTMMILYICPAYILPFLVIPTLFIVFLV